MNLHDLDPATLMPSPELDALIAKEWMGWECVPYYHRFVNVATDDGRYYKITDIESVDKWSPSTNPTHAGEARRKVARWELCVVRGGDRWEEPGIECRLYTGAGVGIGGAMLAETDGNVGEAEALATFRAIVAALQAAKEASSHE
jgi:hypothetical protein